MLIPVTAYPHRGLGAINYGGAAAGAVGTIAAAANPYAPTSAKVETAIGSGLLTAAMIPSPAAPFLAIAGAVSDLLGIMGVGSGCGQSCVLSTQYANQAEDILRQNVNTYLALPTPRDPAAQNAALAIFDTIWGDLKQQCSNPSLGSAGQRCITDRQAGSCKWRDPSGNCWNWFIGYRDPIANDPNVSAGGSLSLPGRGSVSLSALAIPAALLALLWAVS